MKKIFGGINLTWKKIIILAIIIGATVGLLNCVPFLFDTTITDIATYFDFWIFCGIFIIMNSKSNKDAALKCFVFFLISQPLIYLVEVPFKSMGWQLFIYYKYWFIWTILTIPMGYIGYYIKKDKWYSLLILFPMLLLLSFGIGSSLDGLIYSFPNHIINFVFVLTTLIIYPLALFKNKCLKYVGLTISIVLIVFFVSKVLINKPVYDTTLRCSSDELYFDDNYNVYLLDKNYGDLSIKYEEKLESYCINAKFYKSGNTSLIIESPNKEKKEFKIQINRYSYSLDE